MKPLDPRLLKYSRSSRGFISFSVLLSIAHAVTSIAQAYLIARVIVGLFREHQALSIYKDQITTLVFIFVFRAFLAYVSSVTGGYFSAKIKSELRSQIISKIIDGESETVHRYGTAHLSLLLTRGVNYLDSYFSKFIPQLFIATSVPLLVGLAIVREDWKSGVIILLTIPLIPIFGILIGRFTAKATQDKLQTLHFLSGYFIDLVTGIATLKIYKRSKYQVKKIAEVGDRYRRETMRVLKISFLTSLALELIATLSVALLAVSIGIRLVNGTINLRAGLLVLILAPEVYWPIRQVSALFHAAEDGVAAADEIFEILDSPMKNGNIQISQFTSISWSDLTISYDGRREIHIPAGQLLPGKIYGLIGPSGSGKSTFISTLLGFTEVSSGQIIISTPEGNVPFEEVEKKSWRELLSWMPQEPHFKFGSVASIIGKQSLKSVGILESDLPQGLATPLGGVMDGISFGQSRRIALLRAIDKKSSLLFLDEPTASVDDFTEEEITSLIKKIALEDRIIVLSSHRQFTQDIMDEVIYMGES